MRSQENRSENFSFENQNNSFKKSFKSAEIMLSKTNKRKSEKKFAGIFLIFLTLTSIVSAAAPFGLDDVSVDLPEEYGTEGVVCQYKESGTDQWIRLEGNAISLIIKGMYSGKRYDFRCVDDSTLPPEEPTEPSPPEGDSKISVDIIRPQSSNVVQSRLFDFTVNITCTGADCGEVKAYLDPEELELEDSEFGYFIEFKEPSIIEPSTNKTESVKKTHNEFKKFLRSKLKNSLMADGSLPIEKEFFDVYNGMVLDISKEEAMKLYEFGEVKNIVPDKILSLELDNTLDWLRIDEVWALQKDGNSLTGKGITIANIDSGVDVTHEMIGNDNNPVFKKCSDFENCPKIEDSWDFIGGDNSPWDNNGHGTHTATTSAGISDGVLKGGVAPDAKLSVYKVCSGTGGCRESDILAAVERAVDPNDDGNYEDKADVISMSLGGSGKPDCPSCKAIDKAADLGVISIISAGNSGPNSNTIGCPACAEKAIAVGAVDKNAKIAEFSSRGPLIYNGKDYQKPEIVAPGVLICAARYDTWLGDDKYPTCFDDKHVRVSGTSMAAPHVAGTAALIVQNNPGIKWNEFEKLIQDTAQNLGYTYNVQGAGLINPAALFGLAGSQPLPPEQPQEPSPPEEPEQPTEPEPPSPPSEKGLISTRLGTRPFYTISGNPQTCNLKKGESCTVNWRVVPTGDAGSTWKFFAYAESKIDTVYSETIELTINQRPMSLMFESENKTFKEIFSEEKFNLKELFEDARDKKEEIKQSSLLLFEKLLTEKPKIFELVPNFYIFFN